MLEYTYISSNSPPNITAGPQKGWLYDSDTNLSTVAIGIVKVFIVYTDVIRSPFLYKL